MREFTNFNLDNLISYISSTDDLNLIKERLTTLHPYELSLLFKSLEETDLLKLHSIFSDEDLAEILGYIDGEAAIEIIESLNDMQIASIINEMEPDDAIDIIQEFDDDKKEVIINLLDDQQKEILSALDTYADNTAGSIMNTNYISIETGADVKTIMKKIVDMAPDVESITTSFVVDNNGALLGTLDLKYIIKTKSPTLVDQIMNSNYKSIETTASLDETISIIKKYDIYELPVLENGILKGIITMDDAIDSYYEETEDDYIKFAAVSEVYELDDSVFVAVKSRLPWLTLLLIFNLIIAYVISSFDYIFELEALAILVVFQPIILSMAGNCGTQSLAVTISELSKNELNTSSKVIKHISKEIIMGVFLGIIICVFASILTYFILQRVDYQYNQKTIIITVSIAILASILSATTSGAVIPIFFSKIKVDPAAASGPLITTIIDIIAIMIYYLLATILIYNTVF